MRSQPTMGTLVVGAERYDLMATVGQGAFGEVTRGWRWSTGEMVAIKILKNEGHHGSLVKNELRLLQALREVDPEESHIIRFLESFSNGIRTYLVLELLDQNLFDFQKQNHFLPLPVRHIRTITVQLLAALAKLKELSIIHTDLKPENIMLVDHARYPFRVKLIDFGSASIFADIRHVKEPYMQSRFYRAPEILLGLPFCEKMDMWSLGCVMAELYLGWPLFPGVDEHDQVRYICSTLGPPKAELLRAARKASSFFQWVPYPTSSWQLRPPGKEMVKPKERRGRVLSSLDQLAELKEGPVPSPSPEAEAERCDRRGMVELLKRILTWDSRGRITPSAALKHPFLSLQQLKGGFQATRYHQLSQQDLRAARKETGTVKTFPGTGAPSQVPPTGGTGDKSQEVCQAPLPPGRGTQHHQHRCHPRMEPSAMRWLVLRPSVRQKPHHGCGWHRGAEPTRKTPHLAPTK